MYIEKLLCLLCYVARVGNRYCPNKEFQEGGSKHVKSLQSWYATALLMGQWLPKATETLA